MSRVSPVAIGLALLGAGCAEPRDMASTSGPPRARASDDGSGGRPGDVPTADLSEPEPDTVAGGQDVEPEPKLVNPLLLHGTIPPEPLEAPDFVATSHDGEARAKPDLLGHPTVMWFFPFSGTPG